MNMPPPGFFLPPFFSGSLGVKKSRPKGVNWYMLSSGWPVVCGNQKKGFQTDAAV
jgi:hypothetical protein